MTVWQLAAVRLTPLSSKTKRKKYIAASPCLRATAVSLRLLSLLWNSRWLVTAMAVNSQIQWVGLAEDRKPKDETAEAYRLRCIAAMRELCMTFSSSPQGPSPGDASDAIREATSSLLAIAAAHQVDVCRSVSRAARRRAASPEVPRYRPPMSPPALPPALLMADDAYKAAMHRTNVFRDAPLVAPVGNLDPRLPAPGTFLGLELLREAAATKSQTPVRIRT